MVALTAIGLLACGRARFDPIGLGDDAPPGDVASEGATTAGLLLWLPMDDGIADRVTNDASGNGNHAACDPGAGCPMEVDGRSGLALTAFSTNTAPGVRVADAPQWRFISAFTLAAWVRIGAITGNNMVVAKPFGAANANSYQLEVLSTSEIQCVIEGATFVRANSPPVFPAGAWSHVACTYDGQLRVYLDGALVAGPIAGITIAHDAQALYFGCDRNSGSPAACFGGEIDDIRIYDRALSEQELAVLAQ